MRPAMKNFLNSPIYAITDEGQSLGRGNLYVIESVLQAGVRFVQYREKKKSLRAMYEEGLALRELTKKYGATFVVDDYVALALAIGADGVHVGQDDLPSQAVRQLAEASGKKDFIIGLSTHNENDLAATAELFKTGVIDYIGAGPVYPTSTKENPAPVTGLDYIKKVRVVSDSCGLPFVAIGGIKIHNIKEVKFVGAKNFAVVSALTAAENIEETTKSFLEAAN